MPSSKRRSHGSYYSVCEGRESLMAHRNYWNLSLHTTADGVSSPTTPRHQWVLCVDFHLLPVSQTCNNPSAHWRACHVIGATRFLMGAALHHQLLYTPVMIPDSPSPHLQPGGNGWGVSTHWQSDTITSLPSWITYTSTAKVAVPVRCCLPLASLLTMWQHRQTHATLFLSSHKIWPLAHWRTTRTRQ